jgi:hypothetical protein
MASNSPALAHWAREHEDPGWSWSRGARLALRASTIPLMLGFRLASGAGRPADGAIPQARFSLGLASKVLLDEIFFCTELVSAPTIAFNDRKRLARELSHALTLWKQEGWLEDPAAYHRTPPPLAGARLRDVTSPWGRFRRIEFDSGYEPHAAEPGRARWLSYTGNRTAHAWLFEHAGPPRPWVICVPGYRMGLPLVDVTGFRVPWVHRELGLNVAIPVMPLHGPRRVGRRGGDGFLRGDFVDTVHAQAQAIWDIRRLADWLRREGAPAIGAHGVSLGGYTVALLASLEEQLECVIAGIPAADFVRLLRSHAPGVGIRALERLGVDFDKLDDLLRVVSPLAIPPRVPRGHRFVYAGVADRLATADHALDLWRHWERPPIAWYEGSHVSFLFEDKVKQLILRAFEETGMVQPQRSLGISSERA